MPFHSILFPEPGANLQSDPPAFFRDLNLDQIVSAIVAASSEYDLVPFFYTPLHDVQMAEYRQQVMKDLEDARVMRVIRIFSEQMREMRKKLAQAKALRYRYEKSRWFLGAAAIYCGAVQVLARDLADAAIASEGLRGLHEYLQVYVASASFRRLVADTEKLEADLAAIRYCLLLRDNSITVRHCNDEIDYSAAVEQTFEKFRRGAVKDYRIKSTRRDEMNPIESQLLERVAQLFPEPFRSLLTFRDEHAAYLDEKIAEFDRQIQFYVSYLAFVERLRHAGLPFCYPRLSETSKEVECHETFDVALAWKLVQDEGAIVRNDFFLRDPERILVVSGPNQGGKTTFARTFGQVHYLASLGCQVPGSSAQLFLPDRLFTHFEKQEDISNLRGKLEDDLVRIRSIVDRATPNSIIVINEIFASTTVKDALDLGENILGRISALDALCICVTFLDELASLNEKTVSMVSTVDRQNPAVRTFRIERRPADGLAYALSLAEKYGVTYDALMERIRL